MKVTDLKFILSLGVLLLGWGGLYLDALIGMEAIWRRSDTFAHGYFIVPIVFWLVWRDKSVLINSDLETSKYALVVLFISLTLGIASSIADVAVIYQLSSVVTLISLLWLFIGDRLAWHYKFPLAYLLFLVPMGENLIPLLQDITAWFTVSFLKLTGIPVFRDGLYIQTPTGLFEVAVACSGIRYLIASAAVGALFSYLTYTSFKKQIIFFVFACILPIIANGIRAYLIVIIAHYSDMKYATGADHLVYGWFFFGLVIMVMFWIGGKFADPVQELTANKQPALSTINSSFAPYIIATALLVSTLILRESIIEITPPSVPTVALSAQSSKNSDWEITFNDGLQRSLVSVKPGVDLFYAVYGQKQSSGELVSWNNSLFNRDAWTVVSQKKIFIKDKSFMVLTIRSIQGQQKILVYGYRVGDFWALQATTVKALQALHAVFMPRSTSSIFAVLLNTDIDYIKELPELIVWLEQHKVEIQEN